MWRRRHSETLLEGLGRRYISPNLPGEGNYLQTKFQDTIVVFDAQFKVKTL